MLLGTLDATPKVPNIQVSIQGKTEVPGVSREVPCSVLKCETVLDTLMRPQKFPDTLRDGVSREVPCSALKGETVLDTLDATPKFPNIPVSLQGTTEVPGVSREVPCSALKGETVDRKSVV